jgi:2-dehydropantoate 2-reductase
MRFITLGTGAIGGVIAAQLHTHGSSVLAIARGDNFSAIAQRGIEVNAPAGLTRVTVDVVSSLADVQWRDDDTVILAVKSQATASVLLDLAEWAPHSVNVVCAQNGVENERVALRHFKNTYAMCVMCPASYLSPGVIELHSGPVAGVFDLGRWPHGVDDVAQKIAAEFSAAQMLSEPVIDIALLKWGKLLSNLLNAIEALCGAGAMNSELARLTYREAVAALAGAGIDAKAAEQRVASRSPLVNYQQVSGRDRGGGSSWQSLARGTGDIESDFLNGEISLLGRLHGISTPVNDMLVREARRAALQRATPGTRNADELLTLAV